MNSNQKNTKQSTVKLTKQQLNLAQITTKKICYEIFESLKVGMNQQEAKENAIKILERNNVFKWHDITIHFGSNTNRGLKTKHLIDPSIPFKQDDMSFIDIGIVVHQNLEGDFGQTFYLGSDMKFKNLIHMSQTLWTYGRNLWIAEKDSLTGVQLYAKIQEEAKKNGYILTPEAGAMGHHVGIFLHNGPKLNTYEGLIEENLWILEIFVYDRDIDRGAFYEDALMLDDSNNNMNSKL